MKREVSEFQKLIYQSETDPGAYEKNLLEKDYPRITKIRSFISEEGNKKKILELGCATGTLTHPFVGKNEVYGLDLSPIFVRYARKRGIKAQVGNLEEKLPYKDRFFDLVVGGEIVEHIVDTDFLLSECNRVLKKDGKIILSIPNIKTLFSPFVLLFFDHPLIFSARYRSFHIRDFTFSTLKLALENNGFKIVKKTGSNFYFPLLLKFSSNFLFNFLGSLFPSFAKQLIIKAKKVQPALYDWKEIARTYKQGRL